MPMAKNKKRVELRKNRSKPPRERGWTRGFIEHGYAEDATLNQERVRTKGDLSRKRTIISDETGPRDGEREKPAMDGSCLPGRVLRVHGLDNVVRLDDGREMRCKVRRLLKSLASDERNVVTTGDRVWVRPSLNDEGFIEGVEPRHGILTRASRGREHLLVANVDQVVIVIALKEPELKPHLIDRYLASAEQGGIEPIVCLNKADLVDPADFQPLIGFYSQLGVPALYIPLPGASGDEQTANAKLVGRAGGCAILPQTAMTPALLREHIQQLLADPARLKEMGERAHTLAVPDAADRIADLLLEIAA